MHLDNYSTVASNIIHGTQEAVNDLVSIHREVSYMNFLKKKNKIKKKLVDALDNIVQADYLLCTDPSINTLPLKDRINLKGRY